MSLPTEPAAVDADGTAAEAWIEYPQADGLVGAVHVGETLSCTRSNPLTQAHPTFGHQQHEGQAQHQHEYKRRPLDSARCCGAAFRLDFGHAGFAHDA